MSDFAMLRRILMDGCSEDTWQRLIYTLEDWQDHGTLEVALDYLKGHLADWPEDLPTFAPPSWCKRPLKEIDADPRSALYVYAFQERTSVFREAAEEAITAEKRRKLPKFLNDAKLGNMRWRSGETLEEDNILRLISYIRERAKEVGCADLEKLRQLLNDRDCQRWSDEIYGAWVDAGKKSAHAWARGLVVYFGKESHPVIQDRREMLAYLDSAKAHKTLASHLYNDSLHRVGPGRAYRHLFEAGKRRGHEPHEYIKRFSRTYKELEKSERQLLQRLSMKKEELASMMQQNMLFQRDLSYHQYFRQLLTCEDLQTSLASVIWCANNKLFFRWGEEGLVDVKGKPFQIPEFAQITVAHPARMAKKILAAWQKRLKSLRLEPLFQQLERKVYRKKETPIPDEVPVKADLTFFFDEGWTANNDDTGCEYTHRTIHLDILHNWYITVPFNYQLVLYGGYDHFSSDNPALLGMSVYKLFSLGKDPEKDPVSYSEACLAVEKLVEAAGIAEEN